MENRIKCNQSDDIKKLAATPFKLTEFFCMPVLDAAASAAQKHGVKYLNDFPTCLKFTEERKAPWERLVRLNVECCKSQH